MNPTFSEKQELWSHKGTWPWAILYLAFRDSLRNIYRCLMFNLPIETKQRRINLINILHYNNKPLHLEQFCSHPFLGVLGATLQVKVTDASQSTVTEQAATATIISFASHPFCHGYFSVCKNKRVNALSKKRMHLNLSNFKRSSQAGHELA